MKKITLGIIAHVDSGKTTLSEALLFKSGAIRNFGRVDKGDSFLDARQMERQRGITIFSKQASFSFGDTQFTLLDTPGHSDFSAEMERTLQVIDYAILLISGTDGIKGQTETLWKLLSEYKIPTIIFFNKMDQAGFVRQKLLSEVTSVFGEAFVDFNAPKNEEFYDRIAMTDETAMEEFLESGKVSEELIPELIAERKLFPCFFGSALKIDGIDALLSGLDRLTMEVDYPEEFGARVFKIFHDGNGKRLTMMKITGGSLKNKDSLPDGDALSKINQIRIYAGEKFAAVPDVSAGDICSVEGLNESYSGQGFGFESEEMAPLLMPVLSYRVLLPEEKDPVLCLPVFRTLEEENPELSVNWDEEHKEISVQVMGEIQKEILASTLSERFGLNVGFDSGEILYKETITAPVTGVGHFEPLRHYAEVHLKLEPLPEGTGLVFESTVSTDKLAKNWQRLVLTHLAEKKHRGVLTGSPVTDMKITLVAGKSHPKHTEGGDFRQATYRAVRQGLMMAESRLLEPYYRFVLEVPEETIGRAMTDLDRMNAVFTAPENNTIRGRVPAGALKDYAKDVAAYTKGKGRLTIVPDGYGPCRNPEEVIEKKAYDPLRDVRNTADSVFCSGGSGIIIPYDEVTKHMHVPFSEDADPELGLSGVRGGSSEQRWIGTEEVDAIISGVSRTGASVRKKRFKKRMGEKVYESKTGPKIHGTGKDTIFHPSEAEYLLVDGYNLIYAWPELAELAAANMDSARISLLEELCDHQGRMGYDVIAVFDAYRVKGHDTEFFDYNNIHVVFTKEAETADQYIEKFAHTHGKKYRVAVVTSDGMEQIIIRGQGCALISSREFVETVSKMRGGKG